LICDELGYLSLDQQTSNLFYQVISTRHSQRRSTLITTNTAFSDWGNILFNTTIATAIADRLVENSEIFLLAGDSLRKTKKSQSLVAGSAQAPLCDDNPEYRRSPAG
jgi:DNA replication protein DnaC